MCVPYIDLHVCKLCLSNPHDCLYYICTNMYTFYHYPVVETYEWTDRHIFFPMTIVATVSLILLVLFVLLYKRLAPYQKATEKKINAMNMLALSNSNGTCGMAVTIMFLIKLLLKLIDFLFIKEISVRQPDMKQFFLM